MKQLQHGLITKTKTFKPKPKNTQQKLFEIPKKKKQELQPIPKDDIFEFKDL